jgi:MoxR-like ATPase
MDGRFTVAIEDVQKVAVPVLRHRISTNFQAQAEGLTPEDLIARLMHDIPVPEIPKYAG